MINVPFVMLDDRAVVPKYAHPGDAGADLVCIEDLTIAPGERVVARTGLAIAIPQGFVGLVHPRSGLAMKQGVTVVNAPGTIDAGYRGEIQVGLVNLDTTNTVALPAGTRIAQLLLQSCETASFERVESLDNTVRGESGFGSSGLTSG